MLNFSGYLQLIIYGSEFLQTFNQGNESTL